MVVQTHVEQKIRALFTPNFNLPEFVVEESSVLPPHNPATPKDKEVQASTFVSSCVVFNFLLPQHAIVTELIGKIGSGSLRRTFEQDALRVLLAECLLNTNEARLTDEFFRVYRNAAPSDLLGSGSIMCQPRYLRELLGLALGFGRMCIKCRNVSVISEMNH